jgi:hypothetical protein
MISRVQQGLVAMALVVAFVAAFAQVAAVGTKRDTNSSTATTTLPPPRFATFCDAAAKWVGDYSLKVERQLGLNDDRPLPNTMTESIKRTVTAFANDSASLSKLAPSTMIASTLERLSAQLKSSALPINVVRAESAYGATGYRPLAQICPSSMMIMTWTNPIGGVQ